ncbi:hypothetical protein C1645_882925 [Glomus cerebriforme]|uniref:Uncharacterized protein n=1 Tax=Glomus cerebriforme TaxID=658196 RepID=A0A397S9E1_9GLOM|nr:hypothetical protein C1645_882925 [Glomus cerebriforme]
MEGEKEQSQRSDVNEMDVESLKEINVKSTTEDDDKSTIIITSAPFTLKKKQNTKYNNDHDINDELIVPQYIETYNKEEMIYAVIYNRKNRLIFVWSVNIEKNEQQQFDVCFEHDINDYIRNFALYKNFLLFQTNKNGVFIFDLNKDQPFQLKDSQKYFYKVEFLPNGDVILVQSYSKYYKIYKYLFENNNYATTPQIYDINVPKSSKKEIIYQSKLFFFNEFGFIQWDLSKMSVEMEYKFLEYDVLNYSFNVVINKNQTLLALNIFKKIDIFSMETGVWISRYGWYYFYGTSIF